MPIVPFMAMQQISGYENDNLLLGVEFSFKPAKGVNIFANVLADDIGFNDLVKLHFNTKLKFALETGKISASLIQRRFRFGYNRAARIMDLLEERGVVGPQNGSKPREVIVGKEGKGEGE